MQIDFLECKEGNIGGCLSVFGSFFMTAYEWITMDNINDLLQICLAVAGIVYATYKILHIRLDYKLKRKQSKKLDNKKK